jgi:hypothetical protein
MIRDIAGISNRGDFYDHLDGRQPRDFDRREVGQDYLDERDMDGMGYH